MKSYLEYATVPGSEATSVSMPSTLVTAGGPTELRWRQRELAEACPTLKPFRPDIGRVGAKLLCRNRSRPTLPLPHRPTFFSLNGLSQQGEVTEWHYQSAPLTEAPQSPTPSLPPVRSQGKQHLALDHRGEPVPDGRRR